MAIQTVKSNPQPAAAKCLKRVETYLANLQGDMKNMKFKKIPKTAPAFKNEVLSAKGGVELLLTVGFKDADTFLINEQPDPELLKMALEHGNWVGLTPIQEQLMLIRAISS